jgi:hypothetical protein
MKTNAKTKQSPAPSGVLHREIRELLSMGIGLCQISLDADSQVFSLWE